MHYAYTMARIRCVLFSLSFHLKCLSKEYFFATILLVLTATQHMDL